VSDGPFRLIVTDTSPLITLAVADALDILLRLGMPIEIPDAVYVEATRVPSAAGASRIAAWIRDHLGRVEIVPTETGIDQIRRMEEGRPIRNLGEQAAIEVLDAFLVAHPDERAILVFEDSDIARRRPAPDARIFIVSTGDLLAEMEGAGLIQSSDRILDEAARQGREIKRRITTISSPTEARELRRQLRKPTNEAD